jgi:hypothetical protein
MTRKFWFAGAAFVALSLSTASTLAQGNARLVEAQKAYAEVDYDRTRTIAVAALQQGGNDRAATADLYLLWATAAAALDQAEEARGAFLYVLATNPDLKLERSLSPKIRAPYLEARGSASTNDGKPPLEVTLQRRKQELELGLRDTLHVATSIEIGTRRSEAEPFARRRLDAAPVKRLPTPTGSELQFFLRVLDRHGNVLFELGTEDEPRRLALVSSSRAAATTSTRGADASATPYYVTAGTLGVLGVAAGTAASVMFVRREDAARDWNGPGCEHPGTTRQQQCASIDERRQRAEYLSIGFAAAGGGLLIGSLVSMLLAPSSQHASVAVDAGPDNLMLRLRTTL